MTLADSWLQQRKPRWWLKVNLLIHFIEVYYFTPYLRDEFKKKQFIYVACAYMLEKLKRVSKLRLREKGVTPARFLGIASLYSPK